MGNDIVGLLYEIKVNIRKIEAGETECLDIIEEDFYQLMDLLKLFLISERETYYGYFLMNMSFKVTFTDETIAGIKLNEYPPVFISNPLLLCKFTLKEILFIVCHEIEHLILNHPAEMVKSNPTRNPDKYQRFNYAADASVNDRIIYDIVRRKLQYLKFPNGCIDSKAFAEVFELGKIRANESYLYYYNLIDDVSDGPSFFKMPDDSNQEKKSDSKEKSNSDKSDEEKKSESSESNEKNENSSNNDNSSKSSQDGKEIENQPKDRNESEGNSNSDKSNEEKESESSKSFGKDENSSDKEKSSELNQGEKEKESEGTDSSDGSNNESVPENGIVTAKNCKNPKTHDWDCGNDPEAAEELTKEYVNASYEMISQESRGLMPSHFISQINKLNEKPVITWEKVLKKYVGTVTAGARKTRTRLNRRQPERFDLSGKMEDKTLKIVVAIDTSGSVGDREIRKIFNEIFDIVGKRKFELTIIECDSVIQRVYRVKNREDVLTSVRGRGGTKFKPVIEYINNDKYFRDALLIYFTDGYGEDAIPKPRTYRNIWVVLVDEKHLTVKNPYGIVMKM